MHKHTIVSLVLGLLSLLAHIRSTSAGYCTESYKCAQTCNRQEKYQTSCGFLNWSDCTRYRTVLYSCEQTCYRRVCCPGYIGSDCTIPTCYGRTSCPNGNKCIAPDRCQCSTGYHTPRCEDTNECTSNNGDCEHVCSNNVGSFTCSCHPGYTLRTDNTTCEDVDECTINNGGCEHVCSNKPGTYECTCNPGYVLTSDGSSCTDEDECQTGNHLCDHTCYNTVGSYTCSCRRGFLLDTDGHTCLDVDECAQTPYPCPQLCTNTPGSFFCGCGPGYQVDNLANLCTDIDECSTGVSNCNHLCSNTPGSFTCDCQPGYSLQADGATCVDIDECSGLSRCSQICINTPGGYNCSCSQGFTMDTDGVTCKDIDNCAGVTCQNGGYCVDGVGLYTCSCAPGFTGNNCELDIDECGDHLKGGCEDVCVNTLGSYHCECTGNRTIQADGNSCSGGSAVPSVFRRQSLVRRFLPRGCSTIQISRCQTGHDVSVVLSSTSPWYQLKSDTEVLYTFGIVFVELNSLALPISITGLQVSHQGGNFSLISGSLAYDTNDGLLYGNNRTSNCWEFNTTPRDVHDFLTSNSFIATFFNALEQDLLPDWLTFSHDGDVIFGVHDLQTDITRGIEIQKGECSGAPLFDDHLYTMLRFGNKFSLSLYGETVTLPQPARNKKFCFIVDICQDLGGTMFLMLPEDSRDILDKFDLLKGVVDMNGLHLRPKGIGLSIAKHINVHSDTIEVQLWKGDDLFRYPVIPEANFWIGGGADMNTDWLKLSGDANFFLSVPSPVSLLKSVFYDEWDVLLNLKIAGLLELKFNAGKLGNQTIRCSISGEATALASLGGQTQRQWCGTQANPEGIFFSLAFTADAFLDAPVLKYINPDVDGNVYAFLAKDTTTIVNQTTAVRVQDLLNVKDFCQKLVNTTIAIVGQYSTILTNTSREMINLLQTSAQNISNEVGQLINKVTSLQLRDIPSVLQNIDDIWHGSWKQLRNHTAMFVDSLKENTAIAKHNISDLIENQVDEVKYRFQQLFKRMTNEVMSTVKESDGLGLRFKGGLNMFGLKLIGLEIEIVYSVDRLGQCGRFAKAYQLMQGEKAVRAFAALSSDVTGIKLGRFISLKDVGVGLGFAISVETRDKFAAQLHAQASVLGATADVDVFITNQGLYFYSQIDVWAIFKAQIDVSAEVGKEWHELTYDVQGRFVADADGDGSFDDSYSAALRKFAKHLSDEAERRLSGVQDGLTKAQDGLTKAQNWLDDKKAIFRDANSKFDDAVHALDNAKNKLEEAKGPFQSAMDKLSEAQRKVDNLCRIKDCRNICVPGIKCSICHKKVWGVRIPYPCCKFTSCMMSFPDPICVAANLICRGVRALAYVALEAAKVFVRVPMLALDAAKALVSATQFVVDKSRVVLDIAVAALDIANLGLEHAKLLLEGAKVAIEAVKQVIKLGVAALNFVLKYGLENIIDVRNCGFEVQLSTYDESVFDVHCEVNMFKLGFKTIRLRVNFTDIVQSLWYAAKSAIESVLNSLGDLFSGRKRREIEGEAVNILYRTLREANDGHVNISTTDVYETINIVAQTMGYENDSGEDDYSNRVELFRRKCDVFTSAHGFLLKAVQLLFEMSSETMSDVDSAAEYQDTYDMNSIHSQISSFSLVDIGIDESVAMVEFNITSEELANTVQYAKANVSNDGYFADAAGYSSLASSMLKDQMNEAQSISIIPNWINAMDNMTVDYFNESECASFLDCAHFSVAKLYEIFILSRDDNSTQISDMLSDFENVFLNLTKDFSQTVVDVRNMTVELIDKLEAIDNDNVFCAKPPVAVTFLQNTTVTEGQALTLDCDATGGLELTYTWFKDDVVVGHGKRLEIKQIERDGSGMYHCVASNVVANLTMEPAYIEVKLTTTTTTAVAPTHAETTTTPVPVHVDGNVGLCPPVIYLHTLQDGGTLTQFGQSCYEFVPARVSWAAAEKDCQSKNGSLVQLADAGSQNTLYTWIQSFYPQPTWIGMYSFEGQLKWSNGNSITFTNWRSVGSIGYDDVCVVMVSMPTFRGQWELVQCDRQYAYICEFTI